MTPFILSFLISFHFSSSGGALSDSLPEDDAHGMVYSLYDDEAFFTEAIEKFSVAPLQAEVTGLTVPHHLLAVDIMAKAFSEISGNEYELVLILCPDHYLRSATLFATVRDDFETVFGRVRTDNEGVDGILSSPLVSESDLFWREHGIHAVLPFVSYYFPDAEIVPVAIHPKATRDELNEFLPFLEKVVGDRKTLIIESTDFSHYFPLGEAVEKDDETLRVLSSGNPELVFSLKNPDNIDSVAAQYLQMRIQNEFFQSELQVTENRNSQEYAPEAVNETTSYMVEIFSKEPLKESPGAHKRYFFAGDTFFGREMKTFLGDDERKEKLISDVLEITGGDPLIVNLEGVIRPSCEETENPYLLCMEEELTLEMLKSLNVKGVSIANNHSLDFGDEAYGSMMNILENNRITVFENLSVTPFEDICIFALTDVMNGSENTGELYEKAITAAVLNKKCDQLLIPFLHWGTEYSQNSSSREDSLRNILLSNGISLIIGSHPHIASSLQCTAEECEVFSLGNFIFDQRGEKVSSKILELDLFPQGTYFLTLHDFELSY